MGAAHPGPGHTDRPVGGPWVGQETPCSEIASHQLLTTFRDPQPWLGQQRALGAWARMSGRGAGLWGWAELSSRGSRTSGQARPSAAYGGGGAREVRPLTPHQAPILCHPLGVGWIKAAGSGDGAEG